MEFRWHFLIGLLLFLLYPVFGAKVFIIFLSSLIIDIDHIYLVITEKAFSFRKMRELSDNIHRKYADDEENAFKEVIYLFHTAEFNLVLFAFSFAYPNALFVLLGFVFHILIDTIHYAAIDGPILRWLSLIEFLRVNGAIEN
jgi:hypothetical protein